MLRPEHLHGIPLTATADEENLRSKQWMNLVQVHRKQLL